MRPTKTFCVFALVVMDVIYRHKDRLVLTTAGAHWTAIGGYCFRLQSVVVPSLIGLMSFPISRVPLFSVRDLFLAVGVIVLTTPCKNFLLVLLLPFDCCVVHAIAARPSSVTGFGLPEGG